MNASELQRIKDAIARTDPDNWRPKPRLDFLTLAGTVAALVILAGMAAVAVALWVTHG